MLIQKTCHKGLLHLQKIVSQPFSANREPHTAIANLNIEKWHKDGESARSWEWKRDRPIHHNLDSTIRRKVTRKKKQVKFVSLLDALFICLFQLYLSLVIEATEAFRISTNL